MQKKVCLGDLATYINGYAFKPSDWGQEGLPIIRIQNLTGNAYEMNYYSGDLDKRYFIKSGDVLISWSASIGVYEWQNGDAWLNQHIFKVKFDKENVDKKYFQYAVGYVLDKSLKFAHGSTMKHLTKKVFDSLQVPYYSIDKQHQIVAKLSKLDKAVECYEEISDCLDKLVKSRFVELFGDFNIEPSFPMESLDCIADIVSGITKGRKTKETDLREVPYMAVSNVKDGYIDWTTIKTIMATEKEIEQYRIQPNDILMTEGGDPDKVGRGALINEAPEDCIHQNHIFRVRLNEKVNPIYFEAYLQQPFTKRYFLKSAKQTTGIASINMTQLRNTPVIVPSIELQNQFAEFVALTDKSKHAVQQSIETLQTLKAKLMQDYFG